MLDLSRLDIHALETFETLLSTQSVTLAAEQLGRTQSATSHTLNRLRDTFSDPLFYRDGWKMLPTDKALALQAPVNQALNSLRDLLKSAEPFDPHKTEHPLRITGADVGFPLMANIIRHVNRTYPNMPIQLLRRGSLQDGLRVGHSDIAFGFGAHKSLPGITYFTQTPLDWAVFGCEKHPYFAKPNLKAWTQAPHIVVSNGTPEPGPIDRRLSALAVSRKVGLTVPSFYMAAHTLRNSTGLFSTLRDPFAAIVQDLPIKHAKLPFSMKPAPFYISCRAGKNGYRDAWIADLVKDAR